MEQDKITFRDMGDQDLDAVRDLGRKSFPFPMGHLMAATMATQGIVGVNEAEEIIAALTTRTAQVGDQKLGILDWGMIDPRYRGRGLAKTVLKEGVEWLRKKHCHRAISTGIDGYNSGSWNTVCAGGLYHWTTPEQLREFGWRWPKLMFAIPHVIGLGTFILQSPMDDREHVQAQEKGGIGQFIISILLLGLLLLPLSRARAALWGGWSITQLLAPFEPVTVLVGAGLIALYMGLRYLAQWLAARAVRLPITFRVWDSGLFMTVFLAIAFGLFSPGFGGSVYVREPKFFYPKGRAPFGKIMLAGSLASLILLTLFTVWTGPEGTTLGILSDLGRYIGVLFCLTDILLFFWPFVALPAAHIWNWSRIVWLITSLCFLGVWIALPLVL